MDPKEIAGGEADGTGIPIKGIKKRGEEGYFSALFIRSPIDNATKVLAQVGGNKARAAKLLKIDSATLYSKIKELQKTTRLFIYPETPSNPLPL